MNTHGRKADHDTNGLHAHTGVNGSDLLTTGAWLGHPPDPPTKPQPLLGGELFNSLLAHLRGEG